METVEDLSRKQSIDGVSMPSSITAQEFYRRRGFGHIAAAPKSCPVPKAVLFLFPAFASHVKLATVIMSDAKAEALVEP